MSHAPPSAGSGPSAECMKDCDTVPNAAMGDLFEEPIR